MSYRKFGKNDVLINTLKAHPRSEFYIYSSSIYYNNRNKQQGQFSGHALMTDTGFVNLYEYNIDKSSSLNDYSYPFLTKDSTRVSLNMSYASALSLPAYASEFAYGDLITGSYPQFASIKREFIQDPSGSCDDRRKQPTAADVASPCNHNFNYFSLRTLLDHYGTLSEHYKVSSSFGDKDNQELNLIHIPSIFYGNKIKPGTVSLRWYITGTLLAEVSDLNQNGELIVTNHGTATGSAFAKGSSLPNRSGSVQGVVLYDEGFIILTGSVPITQDYLINLQSGSSGRFFPRWKYWGAGARDGVTQGSFAGSTRSATFRSASFGLSFQGETTTETMTLYARALRSEVNYSNNPTFIKYNQNQIEFTSSHVYEENKERLLKNIVSSSYKDYEENFRRQVYISKIGVYDEQRNLIGVATLANPVLKDENEDYVFKLKLDL
tara:strand:+ start:1147 stop:2454 length:1308 start_codon:yes stop_codon:yes gene_type:complete